MKVLVVGSAGYVGSIIRPSLEQFHTCRHFDLVPTPGVTGATMAGSVNNDRDVALAVAGMEALVFLAMGKLTADRKPEVGEPDSSFDVNIKGYYRVLYAGMKAGIRRVVLASSLSTFRLTRRTSGQIDEQTPPDQVEAYGFSKRVAEFIDEAFAAEYRDATLVALRLFWPRSDADWPGNEYVAGRREHPLGPNDMRRLFLAALACDRPGAHIVHGTGDLGGHVFPSTHASDLLGWRPEGR